MRSCCPRRRLLLVSAQGSLFSSCRIDQTAHGGDAIGRKAYALGMFLDRGFVRSEVNAIYLVARDVAVEPLDLRTHRSENADRLLGNLAQLSIGQVSGAGDFTFDNEFGHARTPNQPPSAWMLAC
jgi:hypothetical protein